MTQTKKPKPGSKDAKSNSTLWWILGGVVGLGLIVALAISIAGEEPVDENSGFGDPTVTGGPLPVYAAGEEDVSVGLTAPTVEGADWEGNPVTIEPDGTPKIVIFLAHWCPHCQAEVPIIQEWINDGNLPDTVEIVSVATGTDRLRPNWPPQDWLEEEGWTPPVIMDDEITTVAVNYGMSSTPMFVVLDGDNNNLGRISGQLPTDALDQLVQIAEASIEG
jgi:cytochrome c biogenesis protein CcmG, thiol:disulfide interchange protein DsbE